MPADELGSVYSSDPVRIAQAVKHVGKEEDRDSKRKEQQENQTPPREKDSVELSQEETPEPTPPITINEHKKEDGTLIPGGNIDVTVGE